ncbi:MAG: ABC transporter ATP-binding protein [Rhodospirillales bacterium]|jgi:spermidine/putrescine transport system ATP-binding protein|nr:ABC transporter ATP-binding protein [Rhodospirillales bacterium]
MEHNPSQLAQASKVDVPDIQFVGVTKRFGNVAAVDNVDLSVESGAFFSFLGPSGCGKTTSLRMIAGFEQPTEGNVYINGQSVVGIPPHKRHVNMVFQQYALFPHMDVADNIGYGLRQRAPRPSKSEIAKRVDETLELVRLEGYGNRRVWEMSGGQQQRVALARALINHPTVLLLDEPLAALDRKLRREMQIELQTLQRDVGITFVLVTHDQEEALSMSDQICIMNEGRIVQTGSPRDLYDDPVSRYVADFVGKSNFFEGDVVDVNAGSYSIKSATGQVFSGFGSKGAPALVKGGKASIAVRPELLSIGSADGGNIDADVKILGQIKNRIFLGEHTEYLVECEGLGEVLVLSPKHIENIRGTFEPGASVTLGWMNDIALALGD